MGMVKLHDPATTHVFQQVRDGAMRDSGQLYGGFQAASSNGFRFLNGEPPFGRSSDAIWAARQHCILPPPLTRVRSA